MQHVLPSGHSGVYIEAGGKASYLHAPAVEDEHPTVGRGLSMHGLLQELDLLERHGVLRRSVGHRRRCGDSQKRGRAGVTTAGVQSTQF